MTNFCHPFFLSCVPDTFFNFSWRQSGTVVWYSAYSARVGQVLVTALFCQNNELQRFERVITTLTYSDVVESNHNKGYRQ